MENYHIVREVYKKVLNRGVDSGGLETYSKCLQNGQTVSWLENILVSSQEYKIQKAADPFFSEHAKYEEYLDQRNKETLQKVVEQQALQRKQKVQRQKSIELQKEIEQQKLKSQNHLETEKAIAMKKSLELQQQSVYKSYKEKINVFMCVRNNETTLQNTLDCLRFIEIEYRTFTFNYYIFENDSMDRTPHIVIDFLRNKNGSFRIEKLNKPMWGQDKDISRVKMMAEYRNNMKNLCTTWDNSSISLIIDTNVEFKTDILKSMINILSDKSIVMVTPYGLVKKNLPKKQYYDTYALSLKNNNLNDFIYKSSIHKLVEVNSAFSGFVCIRSDVLQKCNWKEINANCSEHNYFCDMVRQYGKIVIATDIFVEWFP